MIAVGEINNLEVLRSTSVGMYLGDTEGNDVLLPNKYVPEDLQVGDFIEVFIYTDSEDRIIATNLEPKIYLNSFACLQAKHVDNVGAFMDWGLEKDLFVPFKEQMRKIEEGKWYIIYMYLDVESNRLVGSCKVNKFLDNRDLYLKEGDEVKIMPYEHTDLGMNVIVDNFYKGLIFKNEIFQRVAIGDTLTGYIKKVREDNKLDISLQKQGFENIEPNAQLILDTLAKKNGFLALHDNSSPDEISFLLGMSKKTFKKAVGTLYRERKIRIEENGIYLV
ncbi:MAG: hypothetical protein RLZZ175_35 [Bacteroidota bacterium]|jgi:predicted RNA-binding protein (virulence factor B family)